MKTNGHTVLITGGGSGIGFETAKLFAQRGNRVIITGRTPKKLEQAVAQLGSNAHFIVCDVTNEADVARLVDTVRYEFGALSVLMNNAGEAYLYRINAEADAYQKAAAEITTNYLSTVRLTEKFLPLLQAQASAAVINVSSIVAYSPSGNLPTYSASKAALHSYSQILRFSLSSTGIKVFEVMPPLVDTDFAKSIPSDSKLTPQFVAEAILEGMENDTFEIRMGRTVDLYKLYLHSPEEALLRVNGIN